MRLRKAFTLLEILVSIAIGLIMIGTVIWYTVSFARNRNLDAAVDITVTYLRTAAMRSMQSEGNVPHGVSFSDGNITLFRGDSYASRLVSFDSVSSKPDYVSVTGIGEVVFSKQAAAPSVSGNITISNGRKSVVITVYPSGAISQP
jgi:prepilin-type N-terminal cleavage/methylation domain-containing protein